MTGCGSGSDGGFVSGPLEETVTGGTATGSGPLSPAPTVSGRITYTKLVPILQNGEPVLDFANPQTAPVRFAQVNVLNPDGTVQSTVYTDGEGRYSSPVTSNRVLVQVLAQTKAVPGKCFKTRVQDNRSGKKTYASTPLEVDLEGTDTLSFNLDSGYDREGNPTGPVDPATGFQLRPAGPFAVLDSLEVGAEYILVASGLAAEQVPELKANWSVGNTKAVIGTSHFAGDVNEMSILGEAGVDTDEYDWHIMEHEYGHWVQHNLGRADPGGGGEHGEGKIADPRLSFGEGYGNAFSGLILKDSVYKDTPRSVTFDLADTRIGPGTGDPNPGWYSEASVGRLIYRMFSSAPSSGLYRILSDFQKNSPALTTVFSFAEGAVKQGIQPDYRPITLNDRFGINSTEAFAAGETHDAGLTGKLPLYAEVTPGERQLTLGPGLFNDLTNNHFVRFTGTGSPVTITLTSPEPEAGLFENGKLVAEGKTRLVYTTRQGAIYVLNINQEANKAVTFGYTVSQ